MAETPLDPFLAAATFMERRPLEDPLDAQIAVLLDALDPDEVERITGKVARELANCDH